jgi:DNA-directed RNA polymerase subunit RPC12/RpoP
MLTRIACPNCGHVGATSAVLPRVLTCSQCGHRALIRRGKPARSHVAWEEDAGSIDVSLKEWSVSKSALAGH